MTGLLSTLIACGTLLWIVERHLGPAWRITTEAKVQELKDRQRTIEPPKIPSDLVMRYVGQHSEEWAREDVRARLLEDFERLGGWDAVRTQWNREG